MVLHLIHTCRSKVLSEKHLIPSKGTLLSLTFIFHIFYKNLYLKSYPEIFFEKGKTSSLK